MDARQRQRLIESALSVRHRAHAPYSQFLVGAALLGAQGTVYSGCNVENASYGLTLCAERSAVAQAVAAGERRFVAAAVAASGGVSPCGACRQVLAEFSPDMRILLVDADLPDRVVEIALNELLPHRFVLDNKS